MPQLVRIDIVVLMGNMCCSRESSVENNWGVDK